MDSNLTSLSEAGRLLKICMSKDFKNKPVYISIAETRLVRNKYCALIDTLNSLHPLLSIVNLYDIAFYLYSKNGILAYRIRSRSFKRHEIDKVFKEGLDMSIKSMGCNAFAVAQKTKESIYLPSDYHTDELMQSCFEYCVPVKIKDHIFAYANIMHASRELCSKSCNLLDSLVNTLQFTYEKDKFGIESLKEKAEIDMNITAKRKRILQCLAKGMTQKEIIDDLNMSLSTLKYHINKIKKTYNVTSNSACIASAIKYKHIENNFD